MRRRVYRVYREMDINRVKKKKIKIQLETKKNKKWFSNEISEYLPFAFTKIKKLKCIGP